MKRKLYVFFGTVFIIILFLTQFGIDIGGVRIGKQLDLKTPQKNEFKESVFYKDYFSKNDLTVLNLWATWCQPCVEEMPELNKVKKKYFDTKINFLSMSVDTDSVKLMNFLDKKKFDFKDITIKDLAYRNVVLNTLDGRKPENWIKSYVVPVTYILKNNKVVEKIDGQIDSQELISLIEKHK